MNDRMKKAIIDEKKKAGQPVELTSEDKLVLNVANKVIDMISNQVCRRCTHLLVTEDEKKNCYCATCWELVLEQREHERTERKSILNSRIKNVEREIEYKVSEIDNKDIKETFVIIKGDDGKPVVYEGFKDNVKPDYMLYNEIDNLKYQIEMYQKQLEGIKKAEDKDGKTSSDGTQGDRDKGTA